MTNPKLIVVLLLIVSSFCTLRVYAPKRASDMLKQNINYTLSNFGDIPYGETIIGQIIFPEEQQLCTFDIKDKTQSQSAVFKKIYLIRRGTCKFTTKVLNAEKLGGDLAIIYDNNTSDKPQVIMKNDGHGHLTKIPSMFISKSDAMELIKIKDELKQSPYMKAKFEIFQAITSKVIFWLDSFNRQTYILARDFYRNDYYKVVKDRVTIELRYKIEDRCTNGFCSNADCFGELTEVHFCRNIQKGQQNKDSNLPKIKGTSVIFEQLRQYYLYQILSQKKSEEKWWIYMDQFDDKDCMESPDVKSCADSVMKNLGIQSSDIKFIEQSIKKAQDGIKNADSILKKFTTEGREMGIYFYPEATINDKNFYGLFRASEVFQTICDSLIDPPKECMSFVKNNHVILEEEESVWGTVFLILILMTVGFVLALVLYTRVIKTSVNQQMSAEVNKMVENYVNLTEHKSQDSNYSQMQA